MMIIYLDFLDIDVHSIPNIFRIILWRTSLNDIRGHCAERIDFACLPLSNVVFSGGDDIARQLRTRDDVRFRLMFDVF